MRMTIADFAGDLARDWSAARELEANEPRLADLADRRVFLTERMMLESQPRDAREALVLALVLQDYVRGRPVETRAESAVDWDARVDNALGALTTYFERSAATSAEAIGLAEYACRATAADRHFKE